MADSSPSTLDNGAPRYRSSAAARMVNIPVATLRVWERRYQVVGPAQAPSGHRLYSSQDVRRLVLIKQLVNRGHGIGMLARMETARLQDLVDEADQTEGVLKRPVGRLSRPAVAPAEGPDRIRLVLIGSETSIRWATHVQRLADVDVVAATDDTVGAELALQNVQADLILADFGAMHMDTVDRLVRLSRVVGARQMVVVYGFANSQVLEALRARAAILRRSPLEPAELQQTLEDAVRGWRTVTRALRHVPEPAPAARFDATTLARLTQDMPRVACECPQHLAELVTLLGQFEAYSADCESRQPVDVALHAYLYRVAGHARALMEEALATIAEAEGVPLPEPTALTLPWVRQAAAR